MKFRSPTERRPVLRVSAGLLLGLPVLALHLLAFGTWPGATVAGHVAGPARPAASITFRTAGAAPAHAAPTLKPKPKPTTPPAVPPPPADAATDPTPRTAVAHTDRGAPLSPFLPASELDRRPTPISTPDPRWLDELAHQPVSGLPLRLRLFITATGEVVDVEPVQVSELDHFALPALQAMFRNTAFLPGRVQGRDVASQMELEIQLDGQTR